MLATAAVVTAFAVLGNDDGPDTAGTDPPSATDAGHPASCPPTSSATPRRARACSASSSRAGRPAPAARRGIEHGPNDPDYGRPWPDGLVRDRDAVATTCIDDPSSASGRPPDGMTAAEATLAIQQVVYTLQAAHRRAPAGAVPCDGAARSTRCSACRPASRRAAPQIEVLTLVSISDPAEGERPPALVRRPRPGELVRGDRAVGDPRGRRGGRPEGFATATGHGRPALPVGDRGRPVRPRRRAPTRSSRITDDPSGGGGLRRRTPTRARSSSSSRPTPRRMEAMTARPPHSLLAPRTLAPASPGAATTTPSRRPTTRPDDDPRHPSDEPDRRSRPRRATPPAETATVPVYFVGDTPQGPRLTASSAGRGRQPARGGRRADDRRRRARPRLPHASTRPGLRRRSTSRRRAIEVEPRRRLLDRRPAGMTGPTPGWPSSSSSTRCRASPRSACPVGRHARRRSRPPLRRRTADGARTPPGARRPRRWSTSPRPRRARR